MSTQAQAARASARFYCTNSSRFRKRMATGPCRHRSLPITTRAARCIESVAFAKSAMGNGYGQRYGHINEVWHDVWLFERRSEHAGGPNLPTKGCG